MTRALDERLMRRAIAVAQAMLGRTWPNPSVGCVIARGEEVIAEAATASGGNPHAEEQALARAGDAARGATVYVTLEPCGQRSNGSPSCGERLTLADVGRVLIAAENPEPLSAGRGLARLGLAGVPVEIGFLADEAAPLYRGFRHKLATGLPLVETALTGAGFDGALETLPGETPEEALRRFGKAGYTRLWVAPDAQSARQLRALGLLAG